MSLGKQSFGLSLQEARGKALFLVSSPRKMCEFYFSKAQCILEKVEEELEEANGHLNARLMAKQILVSAVAELRLLHTDLLLQVADKVGIAEVRRYVDAIKGIGDRITNLLVKEQSND